MGPGILTRPFPRVGGVLHCGGLSLEELATTFGTPLYVYDIRRVEACYRGFADAFAAAAPLIAYSVKANGNLSILSRLNALGSGADVTSLGELFRARQAGIPADRIVFAGVGKTEAEMAEALREGIYAFNVESRGELERLDAVAGELGMRAPFGLRVNPDVLTATPHEYTRTGHAAAKFGVPHGDVVELYRWAANRRHLRPLGIDVHIGSQITDTVPYLAAVERVLDLVVEIRSHGIDLEYVDLGGGFGIRYDSEEGMDVVALSAAVLPLVHGSGLRLILEPGRAIVGDAGVLLTRVKYVKESGGKTFVIADSGMSDLIRPSHYGGYHEVERVDTREERLRRAVDVVGPICETGDFLARDRVMDLPAPGDLLAVHTAGAYGFTMASNYNGRRRPAEVMVDGDRVHLIRRRETLEDLVRAERPEALNTETLPE
ncbi:MAG: diaminopimelate decarboxylase [Gemmatimonadota bacterium]|nr:diaminopimelate decarboxylase [Gemmatimonadota bacterium]